MFIFFMGILASEVMMFEVPLGVDIWSFLYWVSILFLVVVARAGSKIYMAALVPVESCSVVGREPQSNEKWVFAIN